jgi:hypothetical protein
VYASPALPASPWRAAVFLREHAVITRSPSEPASARNRTVNRKERPEAAVQLTLSLISSPRAGAAFALKKARQTRRFRVQGGVSCLTGEVS